jgi:hypothetical protein
MIWTTEQPTAADDGKWYFVRNVIGQVKIRQIRASTKVSANAAMRAAGTDKELYLCPETHDGITKTSYGTRLDFFVKEQLEFCGPIEMPPDYKPNGGVPPIVDAFNPTA